MNTVWRCSNGGDKLVVRIYPDVSEDETILPFVDRDQEIRVMSVLAEKGVSQPVYARYTLNWKMLVSILYCFICKFTFLSQDQPSSLSHCHSQKNWNLLFCFVSSVLSYSYSIRFFYCFCNFGTILIKRFQLKSESFTVILILVLFLLFV